MALNRAEAEQRLVEIGREVSRLEEESRKSLEEVIQLVEKTIDTAKEARHTKKRMADLRAEAMYLSLNHRLDLTEPKDPARELQGMNSRWKTLQAALQPVRASTKWLEKIREAEEQQRAGVSPAMTEEEREELERRLKDNICPLCVSFSLDGSCTLEAFETCPIDTYLNRLVSMLMDMGHRPWMEDYFERMFREICPACRGADADSCPPREEGDCSLYTYLPSVVRTIEDFMKERNRAASRE